MKILGVILILLLVAGAAGFFILALKSKSGAPPGLVGGALAPCPSSPNCVSSEAGAPDSHRVAPLPLSAWDSLPDVIETSGGRIVEIRDDYLAAEYSSPLWGEAEIHLRSASRVGYGDMGANRKRAEALRAMLAKAAP